MIFYIKLKYAVNGLFKSYSASKQKGGSNNPENYVKILLFCLTYWIFFYLKPGVESGDLIVVLQQTQHEVFSRNHDDLFMSYTMNITEALCGFKTVIKQLDGRDLVLVQPPGEFLAPGSIRAVEKEGMPIYKNPFEKGNLYVKLDVKFPANYSLNDDIIMVIFC